MLAHGRELRAGPRRRRRRRSSPSPCSPRSRCSRPCSASPANGSRSPAGGASSPPASSPSASSASASRSPPLARRRSRSPSSCSSPGSSSARCKREVPRRPPEAAPRDLRLPVEPRHPAPPVAGRDRRRPSCCSSSPSRCSACASASPTRATSPRTPPPARPTTCSSTGFGPGFNGPAAPRRRGARRAPTSTSCDRGHRRPSSADPGVAFVSPGQPQRPRQPDGGAAGTSMPDDRPAGRGDHRARRPAPQRRAARRSRSRPASTSLVTGSVAVQRRLLRLPRRPAAVLLRRRADRCRSCC